MNYVVHWWHYVFITEVAQLAGDDTPTGELALAHLTRVSTEQPN